MAGNRNASTLLRLLSCSLVLVAVVGRADAARGVDVTSCGQTVPRGRSGELVGDLDCPLLPYGSYAVVLDKGARLETNGFTIRSSANGVRCLGPCRIYGAGALERTEPACSGGVVSDAYGVFADGPLTIEELTLSGFGFAVWGSARVRARGVALSGQCIGIGGNTAPITVRESVITGNLGYGVAGVGRVTLLDSTVTGNLLDVIAGRKPRLRLSSCDTSGGGPGAPPDTWGVCGAP